MVVRVSTKTEYKRELREGDGFERIFRGYEQDLFQMQSSEGSRTEKHSYV